MLCSNGRAPRLTLGGGAGSSLEGRDIELSVSPKDIRTSPYDLCANRSDRRQSREGDRWFESTSLRRRVSLTGVFGGSRRKSPAFAGSVSLDVTRERDVLARSRLAWLLFSDRH